MIPDDPGRTAQTRSGQPALAWVVPGPLRQVTGGYLYDARMVDGLRACGWRVGVVDVRSRGWPLDVSAGRRLTRALRAWSWSAVVVDELAHPALAAALAGGALRAALRGAPLVLLVHHLRCSEPAVPPMRTLARLVEGAVARAADLVICTSDTTARTVAPLARPGVGVAVVRPGWDTHGRPAVTPGRGDCPHPPTPSPWARERGSRLQVPGNTPSPAPGGGGWGEGATPAGLRLLLVGHWTPRKGILDALTALARTPPDVTLDLVGEQDRDPAYAARVRAALRDPALAGRVRVHGRVSSEALAALYAEAGAVLLPSTHEGYGMVLAEALAAGLPVVATRVGAVPEVVRDGLEAELVAPGDVAALAGAVARLAADPAERARRGTLARARAAALPGWVESVRAFDESLRRVVRVQ